jgi:hypothetical protein
MNNFDNPFSVETPEQLTAEDINTLFVPIEEYYSLSVSGHVFLHGHRGSGKSMIFRRLAPDCQSLHLGKAVKDLDFFGVYTSIKKTDIDTIDFSALEQNTSQSIISEHILCCLLMSKVFLHIRNFTSIDHQDHSNEFKKFVSERFFEILSDLGGSYDIVESIQGLKGVEIVDRVNRLLDRIFKYHTLYLRRVLSGLGGGVNYEGPLFSYFDFFLPTIEAIKKLSFMPKGPIFLLIDDVDNLSLIQTKVLNTWVSYRTTDTLSFKLSTQMAYKTFSTLSGRKIESPHDFSEIHYSNIYTGQKKDKYPEWVREITRRRLNLFYYKKLGKVVDVDPENYFPMDTKQQLEIDEIAKKYKTGEIPTRGFRAGDDAYRYARPDYIIGLGGVSKSTSTYKYAGFQQLVHLSSGVIRYFLEPASRMFALQARHSGDDMFMEISPTSQNKVIREEADQLLFSHFDKIINECENDESNLNPEKLNTILKLRNLISAIGSLFYAAMKSTDSERRFFSFAISDPEKLTSELRGILRLGVQEGLFYEGYIGTKEGMGRTKLYVLTRRLAPCFNLDPIGFSAYKFLTCQFLHRSAMQPKYYINKLKNGGIDSIDELDDDPVQGDLL